jgi:hypothetical protein
VGSVKELQNDVNLNDASRVNATWHVLPSEFGETAAGLAYITKDETTNVTVGCGCSIYARWAQGESSTHSGTTKKDWHAIIGQLPVPHDISFPKPGELQFFKDRIRDRFSPTITADENWLHALTPEIPMEIWIIRRCFLQSYRGPA